MKQFIHSIWFSLLLLFIILLLLIYGCSAPKIPTGKILVDVNDIQVIEIPAGSEVAGIVVKKKGVFFAEEAINQILSRTFEDGLIQGFIRGNKSKQNMPDFRQ